jgi:outer membrane protein TolC
VERPAPEIVNRAPLALPRTRPQLALLLLATLLGGCRSALEYRIEADEDAYALVQRRREELFDERGEFDIDPPEDSLRRRVLEGEVSVLEDLTLVDCLEIAAENNREFQTRKESLYLAALDVALERWNVGWVPAAGADAAVSGTGTVADVQGAGAFYSVDKILQTGGSILADIGLAITKDLSSGDGWQATSNLSMLFTQPLLRGRGRLILFEPLTQAERNLVYEVRTFERFRRELAVDVIAQLLGLYLDSRVIQNEELNYANVVSVRERNEALAQAGRLSDIQVDQARQNELSSEDRLNRARQRFQDSKDSFKLVLGLPMDLDFTVSAGELDKLAELELPDETVPSEVAVELAYELRPDFQTVVDRVVDAERKSRIAAEALKLGLDVRASVDASSEPGKPLKYNFADVGWSLGLILDVPVDPVPQRNAYRTTLITWQRAVRAAEQEQDSIAQTLRAELRQVLARKESREIQSNAVVLAETRVESANLNLQAGRASTRDLLEAQEALVSSLNQETVALRDYLLARLDLALDMGILRVDQQGIHIERGPLEAGLQAPEIEE